MSKILYILDNNTKKEYNYEILEDTIIYHFSINSSSTVNINLKVDEISLKYNYLNINRDDNNYNVKIIHSANNTKSEIVNHGVNLFNSKLNYYVTGIVPCEYSECICNQENQIINMSDGKSTICPNLLIDNYDVLSSHSAYIGKFNEDVIFYLMSRGISRSDSNKLLLKGFLLPDSCEEFDNINLFLEEISNI